MRTKKSIINTCVAIGSQLIIILLGFVSRRVLIYNVGVEYLGINGLMTNILTIFSLAESGIGMAIGYALYKPLAENDIEKIKSLMRFFKITYRILALLTAIVGLIFFPFLPIFLKGNTIEDASIIYFMFLFSSVVSYLWVYKTTLNSSDQNKYLYTIANTITQIVVLILKIFILYVTKNYILFLSIDIGTTLLKNMIFSKVVDHRYPYLKDKQVLPLDRETKKGLFTNIKALFIGKLGYILSQCSDNLVISSVVNVTAVGLYSNYTILVAAVTGFVTTFSNGVTASLGNLIASETKEYTYVVYKKIDFINYWLYTFTSICLLCLIEPFITIWLGNAFILSKSILVLSVLIYFLKGINSALDIAKNAAGLFQPDRYVPAIEAIFNLAISIYLARQFGVTGVLVGTLLSFIACSFWYKPLIVYKYVFGKELKHYIIWEGKKILIAFSLAAVLYVAQSLISLENGFLNFLVKAFFVGILSNLALFILFYKTEEGKYIRQMAYGFVRKIVR